MRLQLRSLVAAVAIFYTAPMAQAIDLFWDWSYTSEGNTFEGYFVTNNGPFTTATPAAGNYIISDFYVTNGGNQAPVGSISNGTYYITLPTEGFIWNGTIATQFYRDNGSLTNGANFYTTGTSKRMVFGVSGSSVLASFDNAPYVALTNLQAVSVPEPSTYALGAIATGLMAAIARRRKATDGLIYFRMAGA